MKKLTIILVTFVFVQYSHAQNADSTAIITSMNEQVICWNKGDIDCFMETYWKSDSLKFIGKDGITYGWQQTLDNYKKRYPDKSYSGTLKFDILHVEAFGKEAIQVIGKWHLTREQGDVGGHFTLIWKIVNSKWVIVSDHTS